MTPTTAEKLDQALAKLREDQARGEAPPPGEVSQAELARRAGFSKKVIASIEQNFRAQVAARLLAEPDLPFHLRRALSSLLKP